VLSSFFSSLVAEGLAWLLIYRTERYQKMTNDLKRLNKRVEKVRSENEGLNSTSQKKKVKTAEEDLQTVSRNLSFEKMKSDAIIFMGFMVVFLSILGSVYDGRSIGKLPFEPFSLLQGISHRNLPGSDITDCSYLFIYVLSSIIFRTNIQKIFGTTPPKTAPLFSPPTDS